MRCRRCHTKLEPSRRRELCTACDKAYDQWSRQHASDVVWTILAGGTVTTLIGMGLPLLGLPMFFALTAIFAGFGTFGLTYFANDRRRRHQFLTSGLPRAYLPSKT